MITKADFRAHYKFIRDNLSPAARADKSTRLRGLLLGSDIYRAAKTLFVFIGFGSEVDTRGIITDALTAGKAVAVPVVRKGGAMDFVAIHSLDDLVPSRFGVPEPMGGDILLPVGDDLMLVPGLVFGKDGYRVGYGKGFYDCYLSRVIRPRCVGLCFAEQVSETVPHDEYDVALDAMLTDKGWMALDKFDSFAGADSERALCAPEES